MLLENIVELFDEKKLTEELDNIIDKLSLYEAVKIDPIDNKASVKQLMDLMGDAIMRFTAARKGMGIVNKLKDPADRKKHASQVLSNINKLRGLMQRLDKAITKANGGKTPINEGKQTKYGPFENRSKAINDAKDQINEGVINKNFFIDKQSDGYYWAETKNGLITEDGNLKGMEKEAQSVWNANGLEEKKKAMLAMIDKFRAKDKQPKFRKQLEKVKSPDKIDSMAANVMQIAVGNRVIH